MECSPPSLDPRERALVALGERLGAAGYRFTTVTPETHRRVNARPGNRLARRLEDVFGWSRPFAEGLLAPELMALMAEAGILAAGAEGWRSRLRLSSLGELLLFHSAYPTGEAGSVFFGPDSYRFARALQAHLRARGAPPGRAVDIGCGTGAGGFVVAAACPEARVVLVDINDDALRLARVNASLNDIGGTGRLEFRRSDLLAGVAGDFDLICANPPYLLDPAQRLYRDGGGGLGEGLSLAIVGTAIERLAPGGTLLLYTGVAMVDGGDPFIEAAAARLGAAGWRWSYEEIDPDVFGEELETPAYARADRIAAVVLTAEKPRECPC